ncbi:glyoxalase/bleomycin resistance/extradiol dioxygenase family protein [Roseovarius spongiae]|uniref:Glyoxalase/bleomycin resistance/extradiol dioxygenase family protein n=1 Tax=Roseovarius spongiae TaxID=2320272 RepID=A0A3A8AUD7_9RHOB|nr:VOC family protein [Roseovarius spongiae]RKF14648.1 glyoxalase/bleomycin resistance/extradiol dioxygenase family protein [Roseovarius spongiae]
MATAPSLPGILETALYVDDLDAAAAFYRDVIGLAEHVRVEGRHVFMRCADSMLLLFNPDATQEAAGGKFPVPPHGAQGPGHMCFRVAPGETQGWADHLTALGIPIEADFEWPNGTRSIYVRDPAQNSVEFAEASLWGFET